jgi:hypothetical protein
MLLGLLLFAQGAWRFGTGAERTLRNSIWIGPWLGGHVVIGALGRYGDNASEILPEGVDILVVVAFALTIFFWAVSLALTAEQTAAAVAKDAEQLHYETRE